jgi:hypothetical protein
VLGGGSVVAAASVELHEEAVKRLSG